MVMNNFYDAKKLSFFALETFDFYSHLKTLNSIPSYLIFRSLSSSFADICLWWYLYQIQSFDI